MQNPQGSTDNNSRRGVIDPVIGGLIILLLIGLFISPFFFTMPAMRTYGYYFYPRPFFFFPFGFLIFIFLIFLVGRWFFWGWGWRRGYYYRGYWHHVDATEILRQRYARGEITKEQFDQMMKDLAEKS
ncbi:MAG: SHOCT domain-containing protein [Thaumarchaeota archaeon]|nr:SHOCT domain-containing protein [Nitrososphaerota archaeon]MCL5317768.1 SHOCT domain-containing protein [Nitrososphaerota archaeon]